MKRKICVITGSRAEFGSVRGLLHELQLREDVKLQLIVTGMHLSSKYGNSIVEIQSSGFKIDDCIDMLLNSTTASAIIKSVGIGLFGFSDVFQRLTPDLIVLVGDRYELIPAVTSALISKIPICHIHGGEITEGAFDDAIRHAITKMSHLHVVANEVYRKRVIQLGENPKRVFNFGGLGVDAISRTKLMDKSILQRELNINLMDKNLLVTYHPETLSDNTESNLESLLRALSVLSDTLILFSMPNADTSGNQFAEKILRFAEGKQNVRVFDSLGHQKYLSLMQFVDGVVGNSSSGICEAPSFGIGTVNIGDRQKGRLMAQSVINCSNKKEDILDAIKTIHSGKKKFKNVKNPYGEAGASKKIANLISSYPLKGILNKQFFDIEFDF